MLRKLARGVFFLLVNVAVLGGALDAAGLRIAQMAAFDLTTGTK